nr:hypothetical protein DA06_17930 [Georgenia sp. SUBG003]
MRSSMAAATLRTSADGLFRRSGDLSSRSERRSARSSRASPGSRRFSPSPPASPSTAWVTAPGERSVARSCSQPWTTSSASCQAPASVMSRASGSAPTRRAWSRAMFPAKEL